MAYTPNKWEEGQVISAAKLNRLEQGVAEIHEKIDSGELKGPKGTAGYPSKRAWDAMVSRVEELEKAANTPVNSNDADDTDDSDNTETDDTTN